MSSTGTQETILKFLDRGFNIVTTLNESLMEFGGVGTCDGEAARKTMSDLGIAQMIVAHNILADEFDVPNYTGPTAVMGYFGKQQREYYSEVVDAVCGLVASMQYRMDKNKRPVMMAYAAMIMADFSSMIETICKG